MSVNVKSDCAYKILKALSFQCKKWFFWQLFIWLNIWNVLVVIVYNMHEFIGLYLEGLKLETRLPAHLANLTPGIHQ